LIVTGESVLDAVCWGSCDPCVVGINDLSSKEEVVLFPNPAQEALTLNLREAATTDALVTITDATGRTIQTEGFAPAKQFTITTNTLSGGLYFVRISAGNTILTRPFMVNN
jgi:DNA-binding transcriptional regulator LsrR (DeoR family)